MPNKYLASFQKAKEAYAQQKHRPGYVRTFFSCWRHSTALNKYAIELENKLQLEEKDEPSRELIQKVFIENKKYFNNHSFMIYFLDALMKDFPNEGWEQYDPKPIKIYQGEVYRGTDANPEDVFAKGFKENSLADNVEDYIYYNTGSKGISTSKSYQVAQTYALPMVRPLHDCSLMEARSTGYVYKINYRGSAGIDIESTALERAKHNGSNPKTGKKEVNVVGAIKPSDIVCAFLVRRNSFDVPEMVERIDNPGYENEKKGEDESLITHFSKRMAA